MIKSNPYNRNLYILPRTSITVSHDYILPSSCLRRNRNIDRFAKGNSEKESSIHSTGNNGGCILFSNEYFPVFDGLLELLYMFAGLFERESGTLTCILACRLVIGKLVGDGPFGPYPIAYLLYVVYHASSFPHPQRLVVKIVAIRAVPSFYSVLIIQEPVHLFPAIRAFHSAASRLLFSSHDLDNAINSSSPFFVK